MFERFAPTGFTPSFNSSLLYQEIRILSIVRARFQLVKRRAAAPAGPLPRSPRRALAGALPRSSLFGYGTGVRVPALTVSRL